MNNNQQCLKYVYTIQQDVQNKFLFFFFFGHNLEVCEEGRCWQQIAGPEEDSSISDCNQKFWGE